jgi:hypothetical protein
VRGGDCVKRVLLHVGSIVDDKGGGPSGLRKCTSYAFMKRHLTGSVSVAESEHTMLHARLIA